MNLIPSKLAGYFVFLGKAFASLEKKSFSGYPCKLNRFSISKKGEKIVHVDIVWQTSDTKIYLNTLIANNAFEYFSPEDKKLIFMEAFQKTKRYRLTDQYFCELTNQEMFVLKDLLTGHFIVRSAYEISLNKDIINDMPSKAANIVGFAAGQQSYDVCIKQ